MCKKLIYIMTFVLALGSTANAALYLWNGSAGDGLWETPANWTVTDSVWTWPNEERGDKYTNSDTIAIDIIAGVVSRGSPLAIQGAPDGSTTAVFTLNNGSSLTIDGRLATATYQTGRGQIDILGGSTLTITGSGNDLYAADDANNVGTINIVDSTVTIADDIKVDEGEGYVNISGSSTLNADDVVIGGAGTAVGYLDISGTATINLDDLKAGDNGEGHITIGGNATLNLDDLKIADQPTGVGYLDISGTATVTIVDDFEVDDGEGYINIGGDAVISFGDDGYFPDLTGSQCTMTLTGNSVFNVGDDMTIADDDGSVGHVIVTGNATLNAPDELYLADEPTAFATLDVNGTATLNVGDDLDVGEDGPAICNIGENATVTVADTIYIPHNSALGVYEARMTISGNATVTCDDLQVVNDGGNTGYLHISGNPTISTREFLMNNDAGDPATSEVIMDGGTVTVSGNSTINDDNNGSATFTMNGGSFYSGGYLNVSDNLDGTAHLTINDGEMITGGDLRLGKDGGEDIGQVRVFINGGLLQAEGLDIKITDTKIIYTGGLFRIGSASLDVAGMQQLITDGTIVADGAYSIATDRDYTVLNPAAPPMPKLPYPADGAEGVLLGTTLSWAAGDTAVTHDLYFGTSSPPAFIGNQEAVTYYPGPIEVGTTYYWQIVEVEADGTTKHIGDVWSFTTTTDLSTVSEIATQPNPADGAIDVAPDATLSWWPGASAVSHDVYFGTTSPPALIGNTTEFSFDPGPIKFGTTYYWRVDAVEADGTVHTGDIWSFTPLYDVTAPGDTVKGVPDDGDWPSAEAPPLAIDDDTSTKYLHFKGATQPTGFQVTASASQSIVTVLTFTTANDAPERDPVAFELSGSNVSIDGPYEFIASGEIVDFNQETAWPRFTINETPILFENEVVYDHYQVLFTAVRDAASANSMQIAEVELLGFNLNAWFPSPANGATQIQLSPMLTWIAAPAAVSHDVYFGTSDPPPFISNQAETSYDPGLLKVSTTYYWRVDEVEADGTKRTGDVWSFTTVLGNATQPDPADGATDIPKMVTLSWMPGLTAASHDVYFGDSSPPAFIGNQAETSYNPGTLDKGKTYYWRIDEVEADGTTKYEGSVWSFTVTTAGR